MPKQISLIPRTVARLGGVAEARGERKSDLACLFVAVIVALGAGLAQAAPRDVSDTLPGDVVGVVGSGDHLSLQIMIDQKVKTLGPDQEYRDGWILKKVTPEAATLSNGTETRVIGLNPDGRLVKPLATAPSEVTVFGLDLRSAIAAGDVARIMQLRGSPMDVIAAQKALLEKDPNATISPTSAAPISRWMTSIQDSIGAGNTPIFYHDGARNGIAMQSPEGGLVSFTSVAGMNDPGAERAGVAYKVPSPSTESLQALSNALQKQQQLEAGRGQ